MLYFSLCLSAGLLINLFFVIVVYGKVRDAWIPVAIWSFFSLTAWSLSFSLFGMTSIGLIMFARQFGWRPRVVFAGCVGLCLLSHAAVALASLRSVQQERERYPVVSLESRLAWEREPLPSPKATSGLAELQELYDGTTTGVWGRRSRAGALRQLHENFVGRFVNAPGFGAGRLGLAPGIVEPEVDSVPLPAPATSSDSGSRSAEFWPGPEAEGEEDLRQLHRTTHLGFAHPYEFGYVPGFRQAAGFVPHHFRSDDRLPGYPGRWHRPRNLSIRRLELVSLLKQDEPGVYVTENFPRMDELADAPLRPLDEFEAKNLPELRDGAELRAERLGRYARMLGAIRAVDQCLGCHDAKRGDLLGAFSYELVWPGG